MWKRLSASLVIVACTTEATMGPLDGDINDDGSAPDAASERAYPPDAPIPDSNDSSLVDDALEAEDALTDTSPDTTIDASVDVPIDVPPDIPPDVPPPPDQILTENITIGATTRSYVLVIPGTYNATKAYPLVFYFHPINYTGATTQTTVTFEKVAGGDAIVVYPNFIMGGWDLYTAIASNRDIPFVETLRTSLAGRFNINTARTFGAGMSNGAFFVNQMACRRPGFFRAISSNSGGAPYEPVVPLRWPNNYYKCVSNEAPIPTYVIHGLADVNVAPSSGDFTATYWAYVNGCQTTTAATTPTPCVAFNSCGANPVVKCMIPGLAHDFWIAGQPAIWNFFKQF